MKPASEESDDGTDGLATKNKGLFDGDYDQVIHEKIPRLFKILDKYLQLKSSCEQKHFRVEPDIIKHLLEASLKGIPF
jgi:hypothetical protein